MIPLVSFSSSYHSSPVPNSALSHPSHPLFTVSTRHFTSFIHSPYFLCLPLHRLLTLPLPLLWPDSQWYQLNYTDNGHLDCLRVMFKPEGYLLIAVKGPSINRWSAATFMLYFVCIIFFYFTKGRALKMHPSLFLLFNHLLKSFQGCMSIL